MTHGIIDFHTHPFLRPENNLCYYKSACPMDARQVKNQLNQLGITTICGSVTAHAGSWEEVADLNEQALEIKRRYGEFYIPGFHIHPGFVDQSIAEVERMAALGVTLIGELVPYAHGWKMHHPGLLPILEAAEHYRMVVNFHSTNVDDETMDPLLKRFPKLTFVAAHPGEKESFLRHLGRMERFGNYFLDLSGGGLGRMGLLRFGIDRVGKERFLFGTDFPVCPPAMYIGGVVNDPFLSQQEKDAVLCGNAKRILKLG